MNTNKDFLKQINYIHTTLNQNESVFSQIREKNMNSINKHGLPTHRKGNEEWKYSNLNRMTDLNYAENKSVVNNLENINNIINIDDFDLINIVNGQLYENKINNKNIKIKNLSSSTLTLNDTNKFNSTLDGKNEEIAQLNTALCEDPILIEVDNKNSVSKLIVNIINISNDYIINSPKLFIEIREDAEFELIENHVGKQSSLYTSNSMIEILVNKNAKLSHYRLLEDNDESIHLNTTRIKLMENAHVESNAFSKGTKLSRYDLKIITASENSYSELNGLYFTSKKQHLDNYINIDHIAPHCTSRINYKGILNDESHAIFGGTVLVREGAIKTDSLQSDKNLVLSPKAEIDSKPSLYIFVDDILAGHGATAGNIDENTVYYMQSRGLSLELASKMLISGFAMEIIDKVQNQTLFDSLLENYVNKLPSYTFDF
mgnify:FL=1|tara:strand:- start:2173 stop:3465 length:1293 start_codon:yes stop_codon:yes gene_type:complete